MHLPREGSIHNEIHDNAANYIVTINCKYDVPVLMMVEFNYRTGMLEDFISVDGVVELIKNNFVDSKHKLECLGSTTERHNLYKIVSNNGYKLI